MYRNIFPRAIRNDNNLLITLYLLLNVRQISSVAEELCISQSAVSQKLSRLREVFNDQLLIRNRGEMILTAFAQELIPKLSTVIKHIEDVYNVIDLHSTVRPTKQCYTVCSYGDDYVATISMWLMSILNELSMEKEVSFKIVQRSEHSIDDLRNAKVDFFIGSLEITPPAVKSILVCEFEYHFAVSKQHPLAGKTISADALSDKFDFISLSDGAELSSKFNQMFNEIPCVSKPVLQTQSLSAISKILDHTSMFSFLTGEQIDRYNLAKFYVEDQRLSLQSHVYWHELMDNDTFHAFVRDRLVDLSKNKRSIKFYEL